ncbi:MAG: RNA polymerase sigma factor [Oscillospiraceae bacterium]
MGEEATAFARIYKENYPIVYKYVLSLCRNAPLAEEIAQEAFVKAMEHMEQFDGKCRLYVWLCQIAKNTYFTYQKKQKRFVSEERIPVEAEPGPEERLLDRDTADRLLALLDQLSEPYKEVFSLRVFGELSFSQIGAIYEKPDSWARLIYYRAKRKLKEDLDE